MLPENVIEECKPLLRLSEAQAGKRHLQGPQAGDPQSLWFQRRGRFQKSHQPEIDRKAFSVRKKINTYNMPRGPPHGRMSLR